MRVSVCVPTVNRIEYLREALQSIADQTWRDVEVVISDNSGDAAYGKKVEELASALPGLDVVIHHQPRTIPMADNANFLVAQARCDAWVYLPDDDLLCPDFLARAVKALHEHPAAAFAFSDHFVMRANGSIDDAATEANTAAWGRNALREGLIPHDDMFGLALRQSFELQSMVFRTDVIQRYGFRGRLECVLDFDLELRLAASPERLSACYCADRLTKYRVHGSQHTTAARAAEVHRAIVAILEECNTVPQRWRALYRSKLAQHYRALAMVDARAGQRFDAASEALRATLLDPSALQVATLVAVSAMPLAGWRHASSARDLARQASAFVRRSVSK